jgi:hypothetical protein
VTIDADSALDLSFAPGQVGQASIVVRATDSESSFIDESLTVTVSGPSTAIGDTPPPDRFVLYQNAPNPFNPTTAIRFDTAREGNVELRIYDGSGKLIRTLVDRHLPATNHEVTWDGRDDRGAAVASGVYFYRLVAADQRAIKKMVLLK